MKELYASGSGATGIIFANGGKIQIADLPAIGSIIAKNLEYLNNFNVASYNNMHTLTIENCDTIDVKDILEQSPNVTRVRITGIDWNLENANLLERIYKMSGIDKNGYNVPQSVLAGHVHVPVMREKLLADYRAAWSDLDITYDTLIQQYIVTFVNYDGAVLDVQYVDKGEKPVDPIKRAENPITTPTKQSSVSTDYTFSGWDSQLIPIFANLTITATYAESLRKYTVRYLSRGNVLLEETAPYGSTVLYSGDTPSYTAEESAYKYYLFTGWDKSGFVNGNKDINATYDSCEYNAGYFDGKDLSELRPVEIYAMTQVGIETQHITLKDTLSFELGHDYSFNDIEASVIIDKQLRFTGDNYLDTGIALFDEDRDFVLAIDYAFDTSSAQSSVIAQCFQHDGVQGFRAWINGSPKISWGTSSSNLSSVDKREMLVIRHIKGENGIHIYTSNLSGNESLYVELSKTRPTLTSATLILGCGKADDGVYENYAVGSVFWSKIWYADLGDKACRNIAAWTHETMEFEVCGFKNYYLSENSSKRSSLTLLAKHLLSVNKQLSNSSVNTGGWAECKLNDYLNTRLFNALPIQWQQLIKQVKVNSSVGDKSMDVSPSDCYIFIPAVYEVDPSMTAEPYCYEGVPIPYLTTNESRICNYDNGEAHSYWLRSPNIAYASYFYRVEDTGSLSGYYYGYMEDGIRIMFSI